MASKPKTKPSTSITTKSGDAGEASLLYGRRVPKHHPQIECCGTIDEFNAAIGLARAAGVTSETDTRLQSIQRKLVALMGEMACGEDELPRYYKSSFPQLDESNVRDLEQEIDRIESSLPPFRDWVLPGATPPSAALDFARAAARRAERRVVALKENHSFPVRETVLQFLNRVSDYLWLLARETEEGAGRR